MMIERRIVILRFFLCLCILIIFPVSAHHSVELRARLGLINSFHVRFVQKIVDSTGMVLQENIGELWIKHPNCFNYHIIFPEESYLISNGEVLWFYDLSLNQVIIRWLKDIFEDTPLFKLLLTSGAGELNWNEYDVGKNGDNFFLVPRNNKDIILKKIEIMITNQGVMKNFSILNRDNQYINYQLTQYNICSLDINKFTFTIPNGVVVDEQRQIEF